MRLCKLYEVAISSICGGVRREVLTWMTALQPASRQRWHRPHQASPSRAAAPPLRRSDLDIEHSFEVIETYAKYNGLRQGRN